MLVTLSTFICVIMKWPPPAFGTEHVALLLAAWGPSVVFSKYVSLQGFTSEETNFYVDATSALARSMERAVLLVTFLPLSPL